MPIVPSARSRGAEIQNLRLQLVAKAGTEGKLFGSLGTIDIAEACTSAGVPVERSEVRLPDGPIRTLGEHEVEIHLHADVNVAVRIDVISDGEPLPVLVAEGDTAAGEAPEEGSITDDVPAE